MAIEMEAAAIASPGAFFRRRKPPHTRPPGSPCANCDAVLQGPWCHACGQVAEDFHRSSWHLVKESFEGLFHFDSRIWRTVPDLALHPARLTRAYIDGHRAPQIPPLRLFLVTLLLVFFAGSSGKIGRVNTTTTVNGKVVSVKVRSLSELTPQERAAAKEGISHVQIDFGKPDEGASKWLQARLGQVLDHPEEFKLVLESWSERFAFLMLPIAAGLLSLLFVFQRRFYVFDHTIFALHSLSFLGWLFAAYFVLGRILPWGAQLVMWAAPVHLFMHMRGVYGTSIAGTLLRMFGLFVGSLMGFAFLMLGLLWVGLSAMSGG